MGREAESLTQQFLNSPPTDAYCSVSPESEAEVSLPMCWGDFWRRAWHRFTDLGAKAQQSSLGFLSTLPDFTDGLRQGTAHCCSVCRTRKHPASAEYRTRPKPFRFATENTKVAARAKFSAPPVPFHRARRVLKAFQEDVITIYSHFKHAYSATVV